MAQQPLFFPTGPHCYPTTPLPHWNRFMLISYDYVSEYEIRQCMGHLFSQYHRAFPWRFPGIASEDVVVGPANRSANDTFGTFVDARVYPNSFELWSLWIRVGICECKRFRPPKHTLPQLLEAVTECVAPDMDLDSDSHHSYERQIREIIHPWVKTKRVFPHAPLYGVSVVGNTFRRIIAFSPEEVYIDMDPDHTDDLTNATHWQSLKYHASRLKFDRLMFLISHAVYEIETAYNVQPQYPTGIACNAAFERRLLAPVVSYGSHRDVFGNEDNVARLEKENKDAWKHHRRDVEGMIEEHEEVDHDGYIDKSDPESQEEVVVTENQKRLLALARPLAAMSVKHQLQLFGFVGDREQALKMAADFIEF